MGYKVKDLTGQRFGLIRVLGRDWERGGPTYWVCRCDCGNLSSVQSARLRHGKTISCGCYGKGLKGQFNLTHGASHTPTYNTWSAMRYRCLRPRCPKYADYGGRGITICDEWSKFENFLAAMGERPKGMTLGRKDNNGPYCKENCEWQTPAAQARNRRNTKVTPEIVSQIKDAKKNGVPRNEIARLFLLRPEHVSSITNGRRWKDGS